MYQEFSFYWSAVSCWLLVEFTAAFEVTTPQSEVVAVHGRPAVLGCRYTPSQSQILDGLVVTWQTVVGLQVVHSFYYGKDQLERQRPSYRNRTALFHSELPIGNASLRLVDVRPEDAGRYLCSVSSLQGTGKVEVQLKFAAFYTEPRLTVQVHPTNVSFWYESEGYPEPEVRWVDPTGQNLSHHTEVSPSEGDDGLFSLRTRLDLDHSLGVNYTFTLKNQLINQVIERPLVFSHVGSGHHSKCPRDRLTILGPVFCAVFLWICTAVLLKRHWSKS
ncbi:CD276 antigen-like isoform X1 [Megalops cyprinoides]|uniref:CD276 antigen-like isoform X1 n=1 Tax=Megalops cyprinoides TaxID=118141 RepID=UPI0018640316|nr:CD276 antigen-like isoform X1 [Megalops cyprinoides]